MKPINPNDLNHIALGTSLAAGMLIFTFAGVWLDKKLGSSQLWTIIGAFAGMIYCFYEILKLLKNNKNNDSDKTKSR